MFPEMPRKSTGMGDRDRMPGRGVPGKGCRERVESGCSPSQKGHVLLRADLFFFNFLFLIF